MWRLLSCWRSRTLIGGAGTLQRAPVLILPTRPRRSVPTWRGLRSVHAFCAAHDIRTRGPGPLVWPVDGGCKTGSAASPSRYGGRPEAGHDSRDASPYRVVNKHPFGYALGSSSVVQSAQSQAGCPLFPPPRNGNPAFLLSAGAPGPSGPVRLNGVLRRSATDILQGARDIQVERIHECRKEGMTRAKEKAFLLRCRAVFVSGVGGYPPLRNGIGVRQGGRVRHGRQ
jgi:hypothetical protein